MALRQAPMASTRNMFLLFNAFTHSSLRLLSIYNLILRNQISFHNKRYRPHEWLKAGKVLKKEEMPFDGKEMIFGSCESIFDEKF